MKVRVLGCSGAIAQGVRTTSFLVDDDVLIDAGTGVGDLALADMRRIDHVFLTHSHMDHIAALPLLADAVGGDRTTPLQVHALPETLQALRDHVFNNQIWPDFTRIPQEKPYVTLRPLQVGQRVAVDGHAGVAAKWIEALPAHHTVPAMGYAVEALDAQGRAGCWVFSGDTAPHAPFWQRLNELDVRHLVVEAAFSNGEQAMADLSHHLTPNSLLQSLQALAPARRFPIYISHLKPSEAGEVMLELDRLNRQQGGRQHDLRWLAAGQEMAI